MARNSKAIIWKAVVESDSRIQRVVVSGRSRKEVEDFLSVSGTILYLEPFQDCWVDSSKLYKSLSCDGWGQDEIAAILSALSNYLSEDSFHAGL